MNNSINYDLVSRKRIIEAAKSLFARKGLKATVREIAFKAKVNASAINYHFLSKENLYKECLESFAKLNMESSTNLLKESIFKDKYISSLIQFCEKFYELHAKEKDVSIIIHRSMAIQDPIADEVLERSFGPIIQKFHQYLEYGKEKKIIKNNVNVELLVFSIIAPLIQSSVSKKPIKTNQISKMIRQIILGSIGE